MHKTNPQMFQWILPQWIHPHNDSSCLMHPPHDNHRHFLYRNNFGPVCKAQDRLIDRDNNAN